MKYIFNKCGTNIYFFTLQRFGPSPSPNFKSGTILCVYRAANVYLKLDSKFDFNVKYNSPGSRRAKEITYLIWYKCIKLSEPEILFQHTAIAHTNINVESLHLQGGT